MYELVATFVVAGGSQVQRGNNLLMWLAFGAIAIGVIGSTRAPFKSRTMSPDSIERWFYWTGCVVACVLVFVSQWPNVSRGLFGGVGGGIALVAIAFLRTNHLKIGGRIYAAFDIFRHPDRPPALAPEDEQ
ncbi:hypothetical protein ORI20_32370 [Mycobacterium sp. CVI_P3]|uniref:Uncharacterized protein n=1 Tax=Mycobacterium pinniadriaticum TaxID=2994102 RepID=A0ABT3SPD0_9MYCO|nr:hypothetical protein [Mycobacterium pinniadriaticum]MCX2934958.1 hypothetical protein [Mycobacterium pinniadriaticum]MCX2941384.1 hypothetical protein [Mycobacterium pinniadriaticum]